MYSPCNCRYWEIAPYQSKNAEVFDEVWHFDLENNLISIGWHELGDVSKMPREELMNAVTGTLQDRTPSAKTLIANMLWAFFHECSPGDWIIAPCQMVSGESAQRESSKIILAMGKVVKRARYSPGKNPSLASFEFDHHNFLEVRWQKEFRNKTFSDLVFPIYTLCEIQGSSQRMDFWF